MRYCCIGYLDLTNLGLQAFLSISIDIISYSVLYCLCLLAGVVGFEPTNVGVKVLCLTTWLYPISVEQVLSLTQQHAL